MVISIDELNTRSMTYEEFFSGMNLTEEEIKERIGLAEELYDIFMFMLFWMEDRIDKESTDYSALKRRVASEWEKAAGKYLFDEDFLKAYVKQFADNAVESTLRHTADPWYFSEDRARFNAENETLTIFNRGEFLDAVESGMNSKVWHCCLDGRERVTHGVADGQKVGIFDPFHVGAARLYYPRDLLLGDGASHPREVINCRCWMEYSEDVVAGMSSAKNIDRKVPEDDASTNKAENKTIGAAVERFNDVTEAWRNRATNGESSVVEPNEVTLNGVKYIIDGKNVFFDYKDIEKRTGELLSMAIGKRVLLCPRVVGKYKGVRTPDYLTDEGDRWDRKGLNGAGKDALRDAILDKKGQATNYIFDISNWKGETDSVMRQAEAIFKAYNTRHVDTVVIIDGDEIVRVLERNK